VPPDLIGLRKDIGKKLGVQAPAVSKRVKKLKQNRSMNDADALGVLARQAGLPIDKKYGFDADDLFRIANHESAVEGQTKPTKQVEVQRDLPKRSSKPSLTRTGRFMMHQFHPEVVASSKTAFVAGLLSTAVQRAFQALHNRIKTVTDARSDLDGDNLFGWVFKESEPKLQLNDLSTLTKRNEQQGFAMIGKGSYLGFRNPSSHDNHWGPTEDNEVLELLAVASFLHRCVDRCIEYQTESGTGT